MSAKENRSIALVVQSGTLDRLMSALILASTAVAMNMEANLYFTFWGLNMLVKGAMDKAGLPATYKNFEEQMRRRMAEMKYPSPHEMLKSIYATGKLRIYACSPTMGIFGIKKEDLIPEVTDIVGAATFLEIAAKAELTLFI